MNAPQSEDSFALLLALEEVAEAHPLKRKLLLCRTFGEGRELLHALALRRGGWMAFEVSTPGRLAAELAAPELAEEGRTLMDEFARHALVDRAADRVFDEGEWPRLFELAEGVGFREALREAVDALRLSDVTPDAVLRAEIGSLEKKRFLGRLLEAYGACLTEGGFVDHAEVLRRAERKLAQDPLPVDRGGVYLVPGLSLRGLTGRFVQALQAGGARVLTGDPVVGAAPPSGRLWADAEGRSPLSYLHAPDGLEKAGSPPPDLELFSAASVADELREVLRRVMAMGIPWDQVEIVASDPAAYGSALHAFSLRLEIPVSYAVGLPVERTRAGRVAAAYLTWIENGFPADTLRALLDAGDLVPPEPLESVSPAALARRLRTLRIGWRRERYAQAIRGALEALEEPEPTPDEGEVEEARGRWESRRRELRALEYMVLPVLDATPSVPAGPEGSEERVSPAELARGLRTFMELVPRGPGAERIAAEKVFEILDRVRETLTRPTRFPVALAVLRKQLEIRVPASRQDQPAPWEASGGHLHLSDFEHGGLTGRKVTFVVGLQADARDVTQDPVLLDQDRRALAGGDLPTSSDRARDLRYRLSSLLARLRGRVVLSYRAWDPAQARVLAPDPIILSAFRLREGRPDATFQDLHRYLGPPACPLPRGQPPLDTRDVWLAALTGAGGRLLRAERLVRELLPRLDRGLRAVAARKSDSLTFHDGLVEPRPERLDPRKARGMVTSARQLEELGTCPKRYLYRRVLNLKPPEDPDREPDRWLDARSRGILLHRVFEKTLRRARIQGDGNELSELLPLGLAALEEEVLKAKRTVPSPGRRVMDLEVEGLRSDLRAFCDLVDEEGAPWLELELTFGLGDRDPVEVELQGSTLRLRGAVDRVDRLSQGLRVVDYKTGGTSQFGVETGVFYGGRRLQHVVYAAVVERLLGEPVKLVEYHFPTGRGVNEVRSYKGEELEEGRRLMDTLLDGVARGWFVPTENADDCRFCDFRDACRVQVDNWNVDSPPAEWAQEVLPTLEELAILRAVREWEET